MVGLILPLGCRHAETAPSTGPEESPGLTARMYVLRQVAGDPIPAILVDNEHATIVSLADTVWLERDGTGREAATERSIDKGIAGAPVVRRDERPFSYEVARDRITVSFECNDVIIRSCAAPPHLRGVLTSSSLVFHQALHIRTPLVYERVQP
jgi:hypothetical protein